MLPATIGRRPATSRMCPMSAVVVDFPFEPVTAMTVPCRCRYASSISPTIGIAIAAARCSSGIVSGTPGLTTISFTSSSEDSLPNARVTRSSSGTGSSGFGFESVSVTSPRAARKFAAATPDLPAPMINVIPSVARDLGGRAARESSFIATLPPRFLASLGMTWLSQFQGREAEEREEDGDDPEAHDHLRLAPAGELEVMVQRRHLEDAPSSELERGHLDDHRRRLHDEEAA